MRRESRYEVYEPPNIVRKMQVMLIAAEVSTWRPLDGDGVNSPHLLEMATRWSLGGHENARHKQATDDALKAAWALYRMFKEVLKLDMEELERKAKSAPWWR